MLISEDEIVNRFSSHVPTPEATACHEAITTAAIEFALVVRDVCPDCDEADEALKSVATARMQANLAIALNHDKL